MFLEFLILKVNLHYGQMKVYHIKSIHDRHIRYSTQVFLFPLQSKIISKVSDVNWHFFFFLHNHLISLTKL